MPRRRLIRRDGVALLVAEAPPRGARPGHVALDGPAGDRLAGYAGMAGRVHLLERFDTANLLGRWPGAEGKGAALPRERARRAAARLPLHGVVVLLGGRVLDAYRPRHPWVRSLGWGQWLQTPAGAWVSALPHPSGIVRSYNESACRELAGQVLGEAEHLARHGGFPPAGVARKV